LRSCSRLARSSSKEANERRSHERDRFKSHEPPTRRSSCRSSLSPGWKSSLIVAEVDLFRATSGRKKPREARP
jgi:hypothetical protein